MTQYDDMQALFSYGTLQQPEVQQATFGRLLDGRADSIVGYRLQWLTISDPAVVALSGKSRHPVVVASGNRDDCVAGTVFFITRAELEQADRYEAADYRRVAAPLQSGGQAWLYVRASETD